MILALDTSVQTALVTAASAVLVALVGVVAELVRRGHKRLGEVRDQVSNAHPTNLRDDVDRVLVGLDQVLEGQHRHDGALAQLGSDLAHERTERLTLARRVDRIAQPVYDDANYLERPK